MSFDELVKESVRPAVLAGVRLFLIVLGVFPCFLLFFLLFFLFLYFFLPFFCFLFFCLLLCRRYRFLGRLSSGLRSWNRFCWCRVRFLSFGSGLGCWSDLPFSWKWSCFRLFRNCLLALLGRGSSDPRWSDLRDTLLWCLLLLLCRLLDRSWNRFWWGGFRFGLACCGRCRGRLNIWDSSFDFLNQRSVIIWFIVWLYWNSSLLCCLFFCVLLLDGFEQGFLFLCFFCSCS